MKYLKNNKGIALITALMITLLSLVIVLGILYVVTQGIKTSASRKVYRNAVEAAYGGVNVTMYELFPTLANAVLATGSPDASSAVTSLVTGPLGVTGGINLTFPSTSPCLTQKLQTISTGWTSCSSKSKSLNPKDIKSNPDIQFQLSGTSGQTFNVYTKIVDTVVGTPYMSGGPSAPLSGGGVTDPAASQVVTGWPYVYRIEVISEKSTKPSEQGNLSVLYEY
jgi:hypothetical protein